MNLEFGLLVGAILIYLSILISKTGFKFVWHRWRRSSV